MATEKVDITKDFLEQCRETIGTFGAVRRLSFVKYLECALDISPYLADKTVDTAVNKGKLYSSQYANQEILRVDLNEQTTYKKLDMFDVFNDLYREARAKDFEVYALEGKFPIDAILYDTSGTTYFAFMYDAHIAQKISIYEAKAKADGNTSALIVFPIGTNLSKAVVPEVNTPCRLAVVRRSENGNTECQISPQRNTL